MKRIKSKISQISKFINQGKVYIYICRQTQCRTLCNKGFGVFILSNDSVPFHLIISQRKKDRKGNQRIYSCVFISSSPILRQVKGSTSGFGKSTKSNVSAPKSPQFSSTGGIMAKSTSEESRLKKPPKNSSFGPSSFPEVGSKELR